MLALPFQTKANVAPPSVDFHRPKGAGISDGVEVAPPVTELTPRTPRAVPTYMTFGLFGSITMLEIERPSAKGPVKAGDTDVPMPASLVQWSPLSVDL